MIAHAWTVVCEKTIVDLDTNNISLDVVEQIRVSGVPNVPEGQVILIPLRLYIVSLWYREKVEHPASGRARLILTAPDGAQVATVDIPVDLGSKEHQRTKVELVGLPVTMSGRYQFVVDLERDGAWHSVARVPLSVGLVVG